MKLFLLTLLMSVVLLSVAQAALPDVVDGQPLPSLAPMLERVQKSVVSITVEAQVLVRHRNDPFFNDPLLQHFFDQGQSQQTRTRQAVSTGVIVDAFNGLVLTNERSVAGTQRIIVTLADGREVEGQLIGSDKVSDVAIVKIDIDNLIAIEFGDSQSLRVGDFVVSIGGIGGHIDNQNRVTSGIISALAKADGTRNYENFIQSDTGYGPGILVNLRGELIGLNILKVAQTASSHRIGFSTPVNMALKVKSQLLKYGVPQRGFLAVQVQDLTPELADAFSIQDRRGAVITRVSKNSSADDANVQVGDVVIMADKTPINAGSDLNAIIGQRFAGEPLELTMLRQGQAVVVSVLLESSTRAKGQGTLIHSRLEGASFKKTDAQKVSTNVNPGVLVTGVKKGSVAWRHGVRPNDLIVSANRKAVTNFDSLRQAIANQDVLMLNIVRDRGALFLLLQ